VRISVRGFNQNQLGFTLDDIPLGDMSYGNWNGLHISRAIIDETSAALFFRRHRLARDSFEQQPGRNIHSTPPTLGQAQPDVEPDHRSWNMYRTYGRFESGLLGGNTKFYISGAMNFADKWRGHGDIGQNYWQANGKLVHYVGNNGVLSIYADYSNRREVDYQDDNKVWVQKLGYNWVNYGNWGQAIQGGLCLRWRRQLPRSGGQPSFRRRSLRRRLLRRRGPAQGRAGGISLQAGAQRPLDHEADRLWTPQRRPGPVVYPLCSDLYRHLHRQLLVLCFAHHGAHLGVRHHRGGVLGSLAYESGKNKVEGRRVV